ncbi:MAG: response regulator [Flavobacteriaceae bacterium]
MASFSLFSQENGSKAFDTIAKIQELQEGAYQSILIQELDNVVPKLLEAKSLANAIENPSQKALISTTLAYFYYSIYSYNLASSECAKAISYIKDEPNSKELGIAYSLYGLISLKTNNKQNAERYLENADRIFQTLNDEVELAKVTYKKGLFALENENVQVALNYFAASLAVFESENISFYEATANRYLAKCLIIIPTEKEEEKEKNINRAKKSIDRAFELSRNNNYLKIEADCYKTASDIAFLLDNPEEAYTSLRKHIDIKNELEEIHAAVLSKNLDFESNNEELIAKIALQQSDLEEQQKSITMNRFTTGLSVALIIILSLLTLSLFKNNNLRAKANNLLQDKNDELLIAKERAEKASIAKAQFLSTITHELRTPMYAVTGLTHLLLEEEPREDQIEHLNSLKFSGEYLLSLINNILDLNKLEANKVELEKKSFSLKKRVEDVLIALKKSAMDKNNKLTLEYDEGIPPKLIGDPVVLSQVLINLVGNSVKFTENGKINLVVKKLSQTDRSVLLHFEIQDNGVGITLKKQKAIFESFTQGSVQINRKFGGTGLGLSIVRNLLNLMDSKVHLESEIGKGSKFWFDLKLNISDEKPDSLVPNSQLSLKDLGALENLNVLVVEDNKINQMITKKILEKNKIICSVADNGEDAVKMVKDNHYDLILMDIHMPGISGIEATQQIKEFKKDIPVIALTAVTIDENLDDFYKAGFNEIIPKPFKTEDFFEKIYRTLQSQNV